MKIKSLALCLIVVGLACYPKEKTVKEEHDTQKKQDTAIDLREKYYQAIEKIVNNLDKNYPQLSEEEKRFILEEKKRYEHDFSRALSSKILKTAHEREGFFKKTDINLCRENRMFAYKNKIIDLKEWLELEIANGEPLYDSNDTRMIAWVPCRDE